MKLHGNSLVESELIHAVYLKSLEKQWKLSRKDYGKL